jgi:hypothetical protein
MRPLAQQEPGEQADEDDLGVAEDGREPCADLLDAVVPEDEVSGEERAGDPRKPHRTSTLPSVAPCLEPRQQPERRKCEDAPVERARRGGDVCEAEEDP